MISELAVLGLSTEEEAVDGPGGTHVVQAGEYLDLIIEKNDAEFSDKGKFIEKGVR